MPSLPRTWWLIGATVLIGLFLAARFWPGTNDLVWRVSSQGEWLLPLVIIAAMIDSINPCAFSILLITIAFLFSLGTQRGVVLRIGSFYILGLFIVYVVIGLGLLQVLHLFNTPHFMAKVGAGLLLLWGVLGLVGVWFPHFPIKLKIPSGAHRVIGVLMNKVSLPAAFLLGMLVGLCEFPCTGGPYLLILGLLHDQSTYFSGLGYLGLYNFIFVLPLIIVLLVASRPELLKRFQFWKAAHLTQARVVTALLMILLAIIIFNT